MNDFVGYVLYLLSRAFSVGIYAILAFAVLILALFCVFKIKYKNERKFPWIRAILGGGLVAYIAALFFLTLYRFSGGIEINLHLFRAWREAWNGAALKLWLNVILNVFMFAPMGVLLPLVFQRFRKWYLTVGAGFAVSIGIEVLQLILRRGICDVDDLFCNTLGTALGYCVVMGISSAFKKQGKKAIFLYFLTPAAFVLTLAGFFGVYNLKEYGNIGSAPAFTINTEGVTWDVLCSIDDAQTNVPVFRTTPYSKERAEAFGHEFFDKIGVELEDIYYYDKETYFANHGTGDFLYYYHDDGSYEYKASRRSTNWSTQWASTDESNLREILYGYGIKIPENAQFSEDENGWYSFDVDRLIEDNSMIDGQLRCRLGADGKVSEIENGIVEFEFYKNEDIISQSEACDLLMNGYFTGNYAFEHYEPERVEVRSCQLDYVTDSKGFYQPVYVFNIASTDTVYEATVMVPAFK